MQLNVYRISSPSHDRIVEVVARTPASAWSKFVTQRFGALAPDRSDYLVAFVGPLQAPRMPPATTADAE